MRSSTSAQLTQGKGIETDRYATGVGTFAKPGKPENEVTLIESEAVAAASQEYDFSITAAETRRNLSNPGCSAQSSCRKGVPRR